MATQNRNIDPTHLSPLSFTKLLPGALLAALTMACGGVVHETEGAQGPTGLIQQGLCDPSQSIQVTALGETVVCDTSKPIGCNSDGSFGWCTTTEPFVHEYRTGYTFTVRPGYVQMTSSGLLDGGWLHGDQSAYTGEPNGMLTFEGGTLLTFKTPLSQETGRVSTGYLAQDTCVWETSTTQVLCKAGYAVTNSNVTTQYNPISFNYAGYLYACTRLGPCSN